MTPCKIWTGKTDNFGYGKYTEQGTRKTKLAHRVAWEEANGPIPDGMCVLHECDNPPCVNDEHLFLGTREDNNKDRTVKGRSAKRQGHLNPNVKLTADTVRKIRRDSRSGKDTAKAYGISTSHVSEIRNGISWGHLT